MNLRHLPRNCAAVLALCAGAIVVPPADAQAAPDEYDRMLGYLADTRIDGNALAGANGAIAINQAAGDLNRQANLRSIASGRHASADVRAVQHQVADRYDSPSEASAVIGGRALDGASGLASINQASGSGNSEMNVVAVTLATQGMREAGDGNAPAASPASAGGQPPLNRTPAKAGLRHVAVEATALHGFSGVLQLNQVAGAGNATGNQLGLSIQGGP